MKTCTGCTWAVWKRTESGRLHPSGEGRCTAPIKIPLLPAAFYWITPPNPCGGFIRRRNTEFKDHCPYYKQPETAGLPPQHGGEL